MNFFDCLKIFSKKCLKLKILDTILFDPTTMNATNWIFTNKYSYIQSTQLHGISFENILKLFIANIPLNKSLSVFIVFTFIE